MANAPAVKTQAPPPAQPETLTLRQQIDRLKPEFEKTLPKNIEADAFIRIVHTAMQLNPDLANCSPRSLFAACMKAASDGLVLDGREAALVIRNVKVSKKNEPDRYERQAIYQPMVQGLMKLARNSGEIASIVAHVVYDTDKFRFVLGDDERIEHEPTPLDQAPGAPIAVYAIVKLKDGTVIREVMRRSMVLSIGAQGQNAYQYDPEKGKNFAEWWRKTAIRRVVKYVPRSSDAIGRFTAAAEQIDGDFDFDDEGEIERATVASLPAGKKRGAGAALLKDITPKQDAAPAEDQAQDRADEPHDPETGEIVEGDATEQGDNDDI